MGGHMCFVHVCTTPLSHIPWNRLQCRPTNPMDPLEARVSKGRCWIPDAFSTTYRNIIQFQDVFCFYPEFCMVREQWEWNTLPCLQPIYSAQAHPFPLTQSLTGSKQPPPRGAPIFNEYKSSKPSFSSPNQPHLNTRDFPCLINRLPGALDVTQSAHVNNSGSTGSGGSFSLMFSVSPLPSLSPPLPPATSMSLLNHSCDPNCVIVFEGRQLLLRSVREIQIGEEDADMLAGEEQAWKEIKDLRLITEWEQVLAMCQTLLNNSADRLPDTNIYLLKMLDCAMDACINLRRWEEALLYGNRTLKPYRMYYSSFHPLRAVQMMRVGKLQHTQDMFPQALETLKQAYNIMKVTHGADHSLVQDLMKLKEQCEADMRAQ
uniref:SET and MYND domain containing 3 n=1 Tax=Gopherus evgoodei TaxID=1825980 RepID=A0A8C4W962_9SAUR